MTELWAHQVEAINRAAVSLLYSGGFGIFHDMSVGKSRTAIEIAKRMDAQRVLVVCPANVVQNWVSQLALYSPGTTARRLDVPPHKRAETLASPLAREWVLVNYEMMWRTPALLTSKWDMVIYDEVHRCKLPSGKQSRFAAKLSSKVPFRLGLTGTPTPHGPLDAWAVMRALHPELPLGFRTFTQFKQRFLRPAQYSEYGDRDLIFSKRGGTLERSKLRDLDNLHERLYKHAHRVMADDVVERPEPFDHIIEVELEAPAAKLYRELDAHMVAQLKEGTISAANALVLVLRLAQLTGGTLRSDTGQEHVVSQAKERALASWLEDAGEEPVVVFARFHSDLDAVARACEAAGVTYLELSGRKRELQPWLDGEAQVLIAQVQSGGIGIDLTRARLAVFYSLGYSYGEWAQARARIHRPNSKHSMVAYYSIVAKNTVDEEIYAALGQKREVIDALIEGYRR